MVRARARCHPGPTRHLFRGAFAANSAVAEWSDGRLTGTPSESGKLKVRRSKSGICLKAILRQQQFDLLPTVFRLLVKSEILYLKL